MTHYRRGRQLRHIRRWMNWRYGLTAVCCLAIVGCLLTASIAQVSPRQFAALQHLANLGAPATLIDAHVGSSKPAPQGTVEGSHTTAAQHNAAVLTVRARTCHAFGPMHPGLDSSAISELRKLAQYEQLCGGGLAARSSFFLPTPSTSTEAAADAHDAAAILKAYAQVGIAPLIFMEPADVSGKHLDLKAMANGTYDGALETYFQTLVTSGITASSMGMWVYLPEGNLPIWSTTDPAIYSSVVTKLAGLQKQYFPGSQASIMLDSESYPQATSWDNGAYKSLVPYVKNIPKGLITSFGIQGFPWAPPANESTDGTLFDPSIYLRTDLAKQAAQALGIKSIWCNSGTFGTKYAGQSGATVAVSPVRRQQMLDGILASMNTLRLSGFSVSIHLFNQNKSSSDEATDWSYWHTSPGNSPGTTVFETFAGDAAARHIPIWIFDTD